MEALLADFVGKYNIAASEAQALQNCPPDAQLKVLAAVFLKKYNIDERAASTLESCPLDVQIAVLSGFEPKPQADSQDYSRRLMAYIASVRNQSASGGLKRSRDERDAQSSPNLPDLSSAPSKEQLQDFRDRFPIDNTAWMFLNAAPGHIQAKVVHGFKPRNPAATDFSLGVTFFLQAIIARCGSRNGGDHASGQSGAGVNDSAKPGDAADPNAPSLAMLSEFRSRFPMDERAFQYLSGSPVAVQLDVLQNFSLRELRDGGDYSRPLTSYIKFARERERASSLLADGQGQVPVQREGLQVALLQQQQQVNAAATAAAPAETTAPSPDAAAAAAAATTAAVSPAAAAAAATAAASPAALAAVAAQQQQQLLQQQLLQQQLAQQQLVQQQMLQQPAILQQLQVQQQVEQMQQQQLLQQQLAQQQMAAQQMAAQQLQQQQMAAVAQQQMAMQMMLGGGQTFMG